MPKGIHVTKQTRNQIQTQEGEIIPKVRNLKVAFLHVTRHLVLFYISTPKYHKNIPRVIDLQSGHKINVKSLSNIRKGDNAKSKKPRVVILVCNTSSRPVLHFY